VNFSPTDAKKPASLDVLVVDDEPLIRWSLSETLAEAGHRVIEAGDRESAIRALTERSEAPDVVLLDYRLPDSNDLGLLATIRQLAPRTQVILMTAFGTPEVTNGALELGAFRVVGKPFDMRDLAALVLRAHASRG
jgi:two-component system response regulator (stage 0 sporulation protein F)